MNAFDSALQAMADEDADRVLVLCSRQTGKSTLVELSEELRKAHGIIAIALNCITGDERRHFIDDVRSAGLEGEGVTRANERRALLERLESAHVSTFVSHREQGS